MLLILFLLLYLKGPLSPVDSCLSSSRNQCSVASYQYSASCRQQYDTRQQPDIYKTGQYNGFLGEQVQARAYSERSGNSADFALTDRELQCRSSLNCSWRNVEEDQLDWVVGEGRVDPAKLALITGSNVFPGGFDNTFLILASDPRPPFHGGMLVSPAIGCQQTSGILSFRYWRSRSRILGSEPDLDVCTRKVLETTLENCLTIVPVENHTIIASIPAILEPFEIVIRGFGFENEPEGGLILLDQIDYEAHFEQPQNCVIRNIDETQIELIDNPTTENIRRTVSGDTEIPESETIVADETFSEVDNSTVEHVNVLLNKDTQQECSALQCLLVDENSTCDYKRTGTGSRGRGFRSGWKVASINNNVANRLTGIHLSPKGEFDTNFLVADFEGFRKERKQEIYVLEAPEFVISGESGAYLSFKKYIHTQGIEMSICEDADGNKCFWDVYQHSVEPFANKWTKEVIPLPQNISKFFFICFQDLNAKANYGQVGLAEIGVYTNSQATNPLC